MLVTSRHLLLAALAVVCCARLYVHCGIQNQTAVLGGNILQQSEANTISGLVQRALYGLTWGVATIFFYPQKLGVVWWNYHSLAITSALHGDWTLASFGLLAVWSEVCALVAAVYTLSHIWPLKGAMSDLGETIVTLTTRLTQAERGATAAAHHNSRAAAAMKVKVDNASSDAAALRQRMDAGQSALGEHSKLLKRLMRKFKRTHSLGNMQLLSALKKRVRVQRVQRLKLQKQKQQHLRLAKQLKALTGKAYLHDRRIALETRRLARLDDSTTDSFAQQARVITELQDAVHGLASQMSMQNQQHQQQSAAQAARIGQLEQQLWATSGLQSELQTLQSVFNMQQDVHQQDLECLRGQLEAASGERSELSRRQVEADAGLRSQVQLAHQATEDLAAQLKVLLDSEVSPAAASLEGNNIAPGPVMMSGGETPLEPALASAVAAVEPAVKPRSGGVGEPKQHRGHVYKLAARFGATMAPAARSLKKSLSAGQASRQTQMEGSPVLVRANRSAKPKGFTSMEPHKEMTPLASRDMPLAARAVVPDAASAPWVVFRGNSQSPVVPSPTSVSPLLAGDGHSSFELHHEEFDEERDLKTGKGRGLLRKLSSGQRMQGLIESFRQKV